MSEPHWNRRSSATESTVESDYQIADTDAILSVARMGSQRSSAIASPWKEPQLNQPQLLQRVAELEDQLWHANHDVRRLMEHCEAISSHSQSEKMALQSSLQGEAQKVHLLHEELAVLHSKVGQEKTKGTDVRIQLMMMMQDKQKRYEPLEEHTVQEVQELSELLAHEDDEVLLLKLVQSFSAQSEKVHKLEARLLDTQQHSDVAINQMASQIHELETALQASNLKVLNLERQRDQGINDLSHLQQQLKRQDTKWKALEGEATALRYSLNVLLNDTQLPISSLQNVESQLLGMQSRMEKVIDQDGAPHAEDAIVHARDVMETSSSRGLENGLRPKGVFDSDTAHHCIASVQELLSDLKKIKNRQEGRQEPWAIQDSVLHALERSRAQGPELSINASQGPEISILYTPSPNDGLHRDKWQREWDLQKQERAKWTRDWEEEKDEREKWEREWEEEKVQLDGIVAQWEVERSKRMRAFEMEMENKRQSLQQDRKKWDEAWEEDKERRRLWENEWALEKSQREQETEGMSWQNPRPDVHKEMPPSDDEWDLKQSERMRGMAEWEVEKERREQWKASWELERKDKEAGQVEWRKRETNRQERMREYEIEWEQMKEMRAQWEEEWRSEKERKDRWKREHKTEMEKSSKEWERLQELRAEWEEDWEGDKKRKASWKKERKAEMDELSQEWNHLRELRAEWEEEWRADKRRKAQSEREWQQDQEARVAERKQWQKEKQKREETKVAKAEEKIVTPEIESELPIDAAKGDLDGARKWQPDWEALQREREAWMSEWERDIRKRDLWDREWERDQAHRMSEYEEWQIEKKQREAWQEAWKRNRGDDDDGTQAANTEKISSEIAANADKIANEMKMQTERWKGDRVAYAEWIAQWDREKEDKEKWLIKWIEEMRHKEDYRAKFDREWEAEEEKRGQWRLDKKARERWYKEWEVEQDKWVSDKEEREQSYKEWVDENRERATWQAEWKEEMRQRMQWRDEWQAEKEKRQRELETECREYDELEAEWQRGNCLREDWLREWEADKERRREWEFDWEHEKKEREQDAALRESFIHDWEQDKERRRGWELEWEQERMAREQHMADQLIAEQGNQQIVEEWEAQKLAKAKWEADWQVEKEYKETWDLAWRSEQKAWDENRDRQQQEEHEWGLKLQRLEAEYASVQAMVDEHLATREQAEREAEMKMTQQLTQQHAQWVEDWEAQKRSKEHWEATWETEKDHRQHWKSEWEAQQKEREMERAIREKEMHDWEVTRQEYKDGWQKDVQARVEWEAEWAKEQEHRKKTEQDFLRLRDTWEAEWKARREERERWEKEYAQWQATWEEERMKKLDWDKSVAVEIQDKEKALQDWHSKLIREREEGTKRRNSEREEMAGQRKAWEDEVALRATTKEQWEEERKRKIDWDMEREKEYATWQATWEEERKRKLDWDRHVAAERQEKEKELDDVQSELKMSQIEKDKWTKEWNRERVQRAQEKTEWENEVANRKEELTQEWKQERAQRAQEKTEWENEVANRAAIKDEWQRLWEQERLRKASFEQEWAHEMKIRAEATEEWQHAKAQWEREKEEWEAQRLKGMEELQLRKNEWEVQRIRDGDEKEQAQMELDFERKLLAMQLEEAKNKAKERDREQIQWRADQARWGVEIKEREIWSSSWEQDKLAREAWIASWEDEKASRESWHQAWSDDQAHREAWVSKANKDMATQDAARDEFMAKWVLEQEEKAKWDAQWKEEKAHRKEQDRMQMSEAEEVRAQIAEEVARLERKVFDMAKERKRLDEESRLLLQAKEDMFAKGMELQTKQVEVDALKAQMDSQRKDWGIEKRTLNKALDEVHKDKILAIETGTTFANTMRELEEELRTVRSEKEEVMQMLNEWRQRAEETTCILAERMEKTAQAPALPEGDTNHLLGMARAGILHASMERCQKEVKLLRENVHQLEEDKMAILKDKEITQACYRMLEDQIHHLQNVLNLNDEGALVRHSAPVVLDLSNFNEDISSRAENLARVLVEMERYFATRKHVTDARGDVDALDLSPKFLPEMRSPASTQTSTSNAAMRQRSQAIITSDAERKVIDIGLRDLRSHINKIQVHLDPHHLALM